MRPQPLRKICGSSVGGGGVLSNQSRITGFTRFALRKDKIGERLDMDGPFEALHLSCHGTIDPERGPVLALEDAVGDLDPAGPGEVAALLGEPERTPLVFLSACRTAEQSPAA